MCAHSRAIINFDAFNKYVLGISHRAYSAGIYLVAQYNGVSYIWIWSLIFYAQGVFIDFFGGVVFAKADVEQVGVVPLVFGSYRITARAARSLPILCGATAFIYKESPATATTSPPVNGRFAVSTEKFLSMAFLLPKG